MLWARVWDEPICSSGAVSVSGGGPDVVSALGWRSVRATVVRWWLGSVGSLRLMASKCPAPLLGVVCCKGVCVLCAPPCDGV